MGSPCDTDVKWILRAGFNVDPSTLAKNLTVLCTVAFSATVLYVAYSNSGKRPHYTDNNIQVCFPDDEEISEDDHTTQCETRCRHSIVGSSDRSKPPDSLMSFGILVQDVQSPSSPQACRLDPAIDVNLPSDSLGESGTLVAPGPNATNDVCIVDGRQDDKCSENKDAEKLNLLSLTTSDLNSSCDGIVAAEGIVDVNLSNTESACTQTEPSATNTTSGHVVIESLCAQTPPSTIDAASGPDVIESSCAQSSPSTTHTASDGPYVMASSSTQTPPSTTSTASGPDGTTDVDEASGKLGDTSLCEPVQNLPLPSSRAFGRLSNSKFMSAGVSTSDQPFSLLREGGEAHRDVHFMPVNAHFHYDPECATARVDLLRHREESESQRRIQKELNACDANLAEDLCSIEQEDSDGNHFVGYIYGIIREKDRKSYKRRLCGEVFSAKERMGQEDADCWKKLGLGEEIDIRCQDTCTQIEGGKTFDECGSSERSQKIIEGFRKTKFGTVLCHDKGTSTSLPGILSDSTVRGACTGRLLNQTTTVPKEKTQQLPEKAPEKCRDKGTSTSVDTIILASSSKESWAGRPLKQIRTMPSEEIRHLVDKNLGVFERCAEERMEGGIRSVHSQPADPLEQTKRSLKALTETQHWSKMSLPEQYEYLGLLDSTLAAASAEWKGNWNVTYWRQKDSAPLSKLPGLSSLCKPQGESEYISRCTPGRLEVPASQTSSPKCPTPDMVHSCFRGDANCRNIPSSSGRQVEQHSVGKKGDKHQHCAEVSCIDISLAQLMKQGNRGKINHPQVKYQSSPPSTTCDTPCIAVLTGPDETQEHHRGCASAMKAPPSQKRNSPLLYSEMEMFKQALGAVQSKPSSMVAQFRQWLRSYGRDVQTWSNVTGLLLWGNLLITLLHPLQRKLSNNQIIQPNNSGSGNGSSQVNTAI